MADASASAVHRLRTSAERSIASWVASAPSTRPPPRSSPIPSRFGRRWMATSVSGSVRFPWRVPTTRSVPPATSAAPSCSASRASASSTLAGWRYVPRAHASTPCAAAHTRSGVIGSWCTRAPVDLGDRVADRAGSRHARRLAGALRALRPAVRAGGVDERDRDRRRVGRRLELVVEQVRVPLPAVLADDRALEHRHPDAHHDAALDLALGADRVQDDAAVVRRGHLEHAADAGLAVDAHADGVGDERRRGERLHSEPAGAAGRVDVGRRRRRAGALAEEQPVALRRLGQRR